MAVTVLTGSKTSAETRAQFRVFCQTDLYGLAREVLFRHVTPNLLTRALHGALCEWMLTTPYDENLYLLSRGYFKSSVITTAAIIQRILGDPATVWGRRRWRGRVCGPNTRILLASNKGENAEGFLAGIKGHLESNDKLQWAFPDILVADPQRQAREWTQSAITVQRSRRDLRESTIQTIGVTGELVSRHYDHGNFDDIVGRENSGTRDEREKVWDFLNKARPLFDPGSTKDFVGTPWHYADAWARMKAQRKVGAIKLGLYEVPCWRPVAARAGDDPEVGAGSVGDVPGHGWVGVTFPERFCLARPLDAPETDQRLELLAEHRREPSNFNAQYLLDPVSADTAHFPRLDRAGQPNLQVCEAPPPVSELWVAMTVDPAASLAKHADYSAIAVGGFDRRGDLWLLELWQARRDDSGLVRQIYDLHAQFQARGAPIRAIGFENIGFAKAYRHVMGIEGDRRGYHLPMIGLERDTTRTKQQRIGGMQGQWMDKQIHAVRTCTALAEFVEQADKFRMDQENDHDDLLDTVADLYQVRGRPAVPMPARRDWLDAEEQARRVFEQELVEARPALDAASRLVAWQMHRAGQTDAAAQQAWALGTLEPDVVALGR